MDGAGNDALKQLPLAEHDDCLVPDPLRRVAEAIDRLTEPNQVDEQLRPAAEEEAADGKERGKRKRSSRDVYETRALPRSAAMRATDSIRSEPSSALQ